MIKTSDGVNHQASYVAYFDAVSLEFLPTYTNQQTASSSLGIYSAVTSDGDILNVDLGDNLPRGIVANKGDDKSMIYSYKT
jgi:hypothetical protein